MKVSVRLGLVYGGSMPRVLRSNGSEESHCNGSDSEEASDQRGLGLVSRSRQTRMDQRSRRGPPTGYPGRLRPYGPKLGCWHVPSPGTTRTAAGHVMATTPAPTRPAAGHVMATTTRTARARRPGIRMGGNSSWLPCAQELHPPPGHGDTVLTTKRGCFQQENPYKKMIKRATVQNVDASNRKNHVKR
jgi:hypothetical protein